MKNSFYGILLCMLLLNIGCDKSENDSPRLNEQPVKITSKGVRGNIQKGPFISGSSVVIQELDTAFVSTGKSFNTTTNNDFGSFEIGSIIESSYIEIITSGFYFNEVKGSISDANLSLRSIASISDSILANVNLLTTLSKERIVYLVENEQYDFIEAKMIAQNEILQIFSIPNNDSIDFNTLDISNDGDENAILLAVSIVIQGQLSVGNVSEMISKIIIDIKEDGVLNSTQIKETLRQNAKELNLKEVRQNLQSRYSELNFQPSIPQFEKYAKKLVPLEVIQTIPQIGEKEVPFDVKEISVSFNKALDELSVNTDNLEILDQRGNRLSGTFSYDNTQFRIVFTLSGELEPEMLYRFNINSKLQGLDKDYLPVSYSFEFNSLSVDIEANLMANFTFDNSFVDITENGYLSTPYNITFCADNKGVGNKAIAFAGKGSYLTFPNIINPTQLNWSYSIWVKFNERSEINDPILLGTSHSSSPFWDRPLYYSHEFNSVCSYNSRLLQSNKEINNKEWFHIVISIEDAHQRMYINGELVADDPNYTSWHSDGDTGYSGFNGIDIGLYDFYNGKLYISKSPNQFHHDKWTPYLNGCVDNIRFYNRALNKFEVKEIFDSEK